MVASAAQARKLSEVPLASLGGRSVAQLAGVKLTFQQTRPVPMTRENDIAPFIGGDYRSGSLASSRHRRCADSALCVTNSTPLWC